MNDMIIRKIKSDEVEEAMNLALDVFMEFEAPDYGLLGVETFKKDIVRNSIFINDVKSGICPIYCAFIDDKMVAIVGLRKNKTHINLVFTKKEFQRKGIASKLFSYVINDLKNENPSLKEITLNSSPYGLPFYLSFGLIPSGEEQIINGIRFTPMKYIIEN